MFLQRAAGKILNAGKRDVVRSCDKSFVLDLSGEGAVEYGRAAVKANMERVDKAYSLSSRALMSLLLDDCQLIHGLQSLKHYFLVDQEISLYTLWTLRRTSCVSQKSHRLESLLNLSIAVHV